MEFEQNIHMIASFSGDENSIMDEGDNGLIPILVTRNLVLFPGIMAPIMIGRKASQQLVEDVRKADEAKIEAYKQTLAAHEKKAGRRRTKAIGFPLDENEDGNRPRPTIFGVFSQLDENVDDPTKAKLSRIGVFARLIHLVDLPDGSGNKTAIVQALSRCQLVDIAQENPYMLGHAVRAEEIMPEKKDREFKLAVKKVKDAALEYIHLNEMIPDEAGMIFGDISNGVITVNHTCSNLLTETKDKLKLLAESDIKERAFGLLSILKREIELLHLQNDISRKTKADLDDQQREYFLHQQIKNIKEELGDADGKSDHDELQKKAENKKWNDETRAAFDKELHKLDSLNTQSPDYAMQLNYLQTVVSLPWNEYTKDDLSLSRAKRVLDRDHSGMEKVKERILEHMAVLQLRGDLKSPIICLYGPPGVGKTSLGKSIAEAMKRKYVRISLGGLHDEAEIRGHRRTYIGAMPGRIIKSMEKAKSSNPVFILDEIDKVSQTNYNGDPASALLEVLDPEQNRAFHDNYLDMDYDLSKVLFIATANNLSTIPRPLLDRMELIEVGGYITEEKIDIAQHHLVPRELENTGLKDNKPKIRFAKNALELIIERYTRESGVRQLEKQLNKALRKLAYQKALNGELSLTTINASDVEGLLGKPPFYRDIYQGNDYAGVVTGLAWTSVGGEILFIETSLSKSKAAKLTITGNLGDVMKESAVIALEYVKAHIDTLGVDYRIFDNWSIHIHVPEGATPKDGPSAGITIATSIASALTQRKVRKNTAMTGEITLRGKVLPVGGIKEKILAAKRAGITDILLCQENRKDIEEIPEQYRKGVAFHYVENVQDVWAFALTDEIVKHPIDLRVPEKSENADSSEKSVKSENTKKPHSQQ